MKFILQNKHQVRYFKYLNGGKYVTLAETDLFFKLHQTILTNPTFEETAEDIKMFCETTYKKENDRLNYSLSPSNSN